VHLLQNASSPPVGELAQLESTLKILLEMLERVLAYAQEAAAGKPADAALGRYLMGALGGTGEELGKGGFTSSLQVRCHIMVRHETIELTPPLWTGHTNDVLFGKPRARAG
jgi:hypothetical protein